MKSLVCHRIVASMLGRDGGLIDDGRKRDAHVLRQGADGLE
jgi:hypothetical protein